MRDIYLELVDITSLDPSEVMEVLAIRNQPGVRQNMYTDHVIQPEEHLGWIERLKSSRDTIFFAVRHEGEIVGGVSLSGMSPVHKRADWAFYLSETCHGKGIGSALERHFLAKAFREFTIEKLNCEVISFNEKVAAMHERFGFVREGVRRDHVVRGGVKFDAILLGITKAEWEATQCPVS